MVKKKKLLYLDQYNISSSDNMNPITGPLVSVITHETNKSETIIKTIKIESLLRELFCK